MTDSQSNLIYYEFRGQGDQTVLLINGLARSGLHWLDFPDELAQMGYRVLMIDNRGFGRSSHLPMSVTTKIKDLAMDVRMILEKENIADIHIVGLSLGGMIALELASQIPMHAKSLTVVNSSAARTHPLRLTPKGLMKLAHMGLQRTAEERTKVELSVLTTLTEKDPRFKNVFARMVSIEKEYPVRVTNVSLQINAALAFRLAPIKQNLTMPLQIIYSSGDQFVPNQNSFGIQKALPHGVLQCVEGKGHELMIEAPQKVATMVRQHIFSLQ